MLFKSVEPTNVKSIITQLSADLDEVNIDTISKNFDKLDTLSETRKHIELSRDCAEQSISHYQWGILAGRILMREIYQQIPKSFSETTKAISFLLNNEYTKFVIENAEELDKIIDITRDENFDYFAVATLKRTYLLKYNKDGDICFMESPQYMWLRCATFTYFPDIEKIKEMYNDISIYYTHATPTLCNSGLRKPQLSSCFLMEIGDSMNSISENWKYSAVISMNMGGIGKDYSALRHSEIGNRGESGGIIPWIKIESEIMSGVNQSGQRKGSQTAFLDVSHRDIFEFINMRKETTPEEMRALDMNYAIVIPDIFMERVLKNEDWMIICPNKTNKLYEKYGYEYELEYMKLYNKYYNLIVKEGIKKSFVKFVRARDIFSEIIRTQYETGMPFIFYKDAVNRKNNQSHLGTIRSSNLCMEINEYTDENNIASCNLASIKLDSYIHNNKFDFELLAQKIRNIVENLNKVIDRNYYPDNEVKQIRETNMRYRPLGIGVQALADVFAKLKISWESKEAFDLQNKIFEVMYYNALLQSAIIGEREGNYTSHNNSWLGKGFFQFDLWERERCIKEGKLEEFEFKTPGDYYSLEEWNILRERCMKYQRNSLLIALMPTASSAGILNSNECFEPFTENIYARKVLGGQFVMMNRHLVDELNKRGLWTTENVKNIIKNNGSVQNLFEDNQELNNKEWVKDFKRRYKTVFEISQKELLDMNISRSKYVCQSISYNCWMKPSDENAFKKLWNYHLYGWSKGLKTGMYYLRGKPNSVPIGVALETFTLNKKKKNGIVCDGDVCVMCSS